MGEASGAKNVILSEDFYLGVYETTQGQWYNVTGKNPASFIEASSRALRPIERVSYYDIRESVDNTANINYSWPSKGSAVHPNSFMGKLRTYTVPNILFDLPTEAQWEYACRAGTVTYYSDGRGTPSNTHSNEFMDSLGRYAYNGGKVWDGSNWNDPPSISDITHGTTVVGSYLPNPWGLYDLHGNVHEWCLDWYGGASMFGGDDPVGPSSADYRVIRGGAWNSEALDCKSTSRSSYFGPSSCYYAIGFRIAAKVVSMPSVPEE